MAVLENAKHELFAQEIAKGRPQREAYKTAGFRAANNNVADVGASRLLSEAKLEARIAELLAVSAVSVGVTVEGQTTHLERIAKAAEQLGEVGGLSVARAAHMDIAKLNGLIIEKKEVRTGALDDLPAATLAAAREQLIAARDRRADRSVLEGNSGKPH